MRAIFLDIETTGLDPLRHHAIDIAFKIVDVTNLKILKTYQTLIKLSPESWAERDLISMEINGYTIERVETGKTAQEVGEEIILLLNEYQIQRGSAVFICQNPSFDRAFFSRLIDVYTQERLNWPYHWLDLASMFWALQVQKHKVENTPFPEIITLSKNEIAKNCFLAEEETPHQALRGVEHLISCYEALFGVKFE